MTSPMGTWSDSETSATCLSRAVIKLFPRSVLQCISEALSRSFGGSDHENISTLLFQVEFKFDNVICSDRSVMIFAHRWTLEAIVARCAKTVTRFTFFKKSLAVGGVDLGVQLPWEARSRARTLLKNVLGCPQNKVREDGHEKRRAHRACCGMGCGRKLRHNNSPGAGLSERADPSHQRLPARQHRRHLGPRCRRHDRADPRPAACAR